MAETEQAILGLTQDEIKYAMRFLGREPTEVEWAIIDAEWSEHCSYKSSKKLLKSLPTSGKNVLVGPGYDAGVVDVGDGFVISMHIESHNHPSAVDPYGGAATGIGGVLRDILSIGTRPVALIDVLRFGNIDKSVHSQWLFRNVIRGIADYGNCVGVPTVAGEVEFDESFERNCLVDVACVGVGRKEDLVLAEAKNPGDIVVIAGGSTGRDGIRGATFASKNLAKNADSDRSSVQVPDPFMKKLLLDSIFEALATGEIKGMKDLGGGGLSSALSEMASKGGAGIEVELKQLNLREPDVTPTEAMISESQERMLLVLGKEKSEKTLRILRKYEVPTAIIGRVTDDGLITVKNGGKVVARLPADFLANAPLIARDQSAPMPRQTTAAEPRGTADLSRALLTLLSSPNIGSRRWIYEQYDHEVGVRTVLKPGQADSSVLRLPNGRFLAVKADGNSRMSSLDPYNGAAGCVAEACRNVVAVGAEPLALVDHLQFGDPGDTEVYWGFAESVRGISDYCREVGVPVVGGKVSFYNQDEHTGTPIKPSPVALVTGLIRDQKHITSSALKNDGDALFIVGRTRLELGGSAYYDRILGRDVGTPPKARPEEDRETNSLVLRLIRAGVTTSVHDCSKGGIGLALAEMCIPTRTGADVDLQEAPRDPMGADSLLFSETHGRFLASVRPSRVRKAERMLAESKVPHARIGKVGGRSLVVRLRRKRLVVLGVREMARAWESSIPRAMGEGV
ncbi:MAG: phosphoribosylformylglycinamidine synthase subunit PurL [Nitrososphaerales archaeon]|jgi:phosphoribosylformylglycinamidine synthase